jgi:hypothetical protein
VVLGAAAMMPHPCDEPAAVAARTLSSMADERERRLALNEAAFRVANERMDRWPERRERDEPASYYCECSLLECRERIQLTRAEYEHVRGNSRHFALLPGHEVPDIETVIERADGHVIVEKAPSATPFVEGSDPRRP